ncbi:MAG: DUF4149 domain-containing protein [Candidatus Competibacteraceae bacterium]|jgi:hypothetical protein|nr:DUF4149 domain-containing protein [Candidatus Competibacteraceae bacterium]
MMTSLMLAIAAVSAGLWTGAITFHSFIVAPLVFKNLETDQARVFLRALFPRFFKFGLGCGIVLVLALVMTGSGLGWSAVLLGLLGTAVVMTGLEAYSLWLIPSINAARDAGDAGAKRFKFLHGLSVLLTLAILLLGLGVLITLGAYGGASYI